MASFTETKDRVVDKVKVMGSGRMVFRVLGILVLLVVFYFAVGAVWIHTIDDDTSFVPPHPIEGGSRAVDMAAALVEREDTHRWTANDPFFLPGSVLDNMPNFQTGIVYAVSRFGTALTEQLARSRGTSAVDPDADRAAGLLRYPGDIWMFNFNASLAPTATSESQYRAAAARRDSGGRRRADEPFPGQADRLRADQRGTEAPARGGAARLQPARRQWHRHL